MINKEAVKQTVEEWMKANGFFLVDLKIGNDNLISIEMESEKTSVDIDDCAALSQFFESRFDREVEDYSLEVSSAGIGYPFKVTKQYLKHIGKDVEVSLRNGKRFTGVLESADENGFTVNVVRKVKEEGAKRPIEKAFSEHYLYEESNSVRYHLVF